MNSENNVNEIPFHALANIFPLLDGEDFQKLADDVGAHGLREPVVLYEGAILDGRNRYRACKAADVDCRFVTYGGSDPIAYVVSLNLHRRHLTESQRAMVVASLANISRGGDRKSDQTANLQFEAHVPQITTAEAAKLLNVSERLAHSARKVRSDGAPELQQAVEQGRVSVSAAADVATLPIEEQAVIVAVGEKEILERAKAIRTAKAEARRAELAEVASRPVILPEGKFGTIVIDPPWQMEKIERDVAPDQVAFDYPTMDEEQLVAFGEKVNGCAADDCHMFMWTTHKHLPFALRLLTAWGWKYVLTMVWHKPGGFQPFGLPQYNCEFAIYARKGSPKFVDTKAFNVCFQAPRREHSRKPDEFYDVVRRVTGDGRIDIFSREPRDGFAQLGNESDKFGEVA